MSEKIFMKPGKDNEEDRINFVKYWAEYIRTHTDKEWSEQQNVLINSQINSAKAFFERLKKTEEGRAILAKLIQVKKHS